MNYHIDIFLDIIDNFGDMGFALELLISMESREKGKYQFRIFTNNPLLLQGFFSRNNELLGKYEILDESLSQENTLAPMIFLLFHRKSPDLIDGHKRCILRFDYVSLDDDWLNMNGVEHISSTETTKIFELIPSPLPKGAGLIQHKIKKMDRGEWIEKNKLSQKIQDKKWLVIFAYESTLKRLELADLPEDVFVLFVGSRNKTMLEIEGKYPNQVQLLDILTFYSYFSLLHMADMNIIRGEVSFVQALERGRPFFWDLYKEKGGFPQEMSQQFLKLGDFPHSYCALHNDINTGEGAISLSRIWSFHEEIEAFSKIGNIARKKNIIDIIERYIDKYYFNF